MREGAIFRIGIAQESEIDPLLSLADPYINAGWEVVQSLTSWYEGEGGIKPLLATSWTASADVTSFTFELRRGVKFHDGTDFNAAAVKANVDRWLDPKVQFLDYGGIRNIKTATVIDDNHIRLDLKTPNGFFPHVLSVYSAAILSPASLTAEGNTPQRVTRLVGTGPYLLREATKGVHVLLDRNESYWGPKPAYKRMQFKIIPDPATREAQLRSGGVDAIFAPPISSVASLQSDPSYRVLTAPGRRHLSLTINTQNRVQPLLNDKRVRQALNYAVDRKTIIKNVLMNLVDEADSPIPASMADCKTGPYEYNPKKARELLAQAGASNLTVRLVTYSGRFIADQQTSVAIAGMLKDVGVTVDGPQVKDNPTVGAMLTVAPDKADRDLVFAGLAAPQPEVGQQISYFAGWRLPPGGNNQAYYVNPQVDALIQKGNNNPDRQAAFRDYCAAARIIWDDAPWIFLWIPKALLVHSTKVTGMFLLANDTANFNTARPVE